MKIARHIVFGIIAVLSFVCCSNRHDILLENMDVIKKEGDTDPMQSLIKLYSIEDSIHNSSEYVKNKYLLLKIRLQDKSDIIPVSSDTIDQIVKYFDRYGNNEERMEAYYYQGSVYRDLNDLPRSITSFLNVLDIAKKCNAEPSKLLQNTCSQLSALYNKQDLYDNALIMAEAGCKMAEETKTVDPIYLMDVASAADLVGDTAKSLKYCDKTLECIKRDSSYLYPSVICELLIKYTDNNLKNKADECFHILPKFDNVKNTHNYLDALATYYNSYVSVDSALACYEKMFSDGNIAQKSISSRVLAYYNYDIGNYQKSCMYAMQYFLYKDSVSEGMQYEQTSRACGEHLYAVSLAKELEARKVADRRMKWVYVSIVTVLFVILIANVLYWRKKIELRDKSLALDEAQCSLEQSIAQLEENKEKLRNKQKQVNELVRKSLRENVSCNEKELLQKFTDASHGHGTVDEDDWNALRVMMLSMYPEFSEALSGLPRLSGYGVKTALLMKIGMSTSQITSLTNCPRQTVWNRENRIREVLGDLLDA